LALLIGQRQSSIPLGHCEFSLTDVLNAFTALVQAVAEQQVASR
jgi:hypothetical protein